ncbi:MAG: RNA-binding cell elongation regulator Jag/EloR [Ilumatobacteraceae bacterium]
MEWVETTARTIDEAKSKALDQLGVAEDDAEFDILEEPRPGLFGRLRGEARVRARVRPTQPRPKLDRRDRKKRGDGSAKQAATSADTPDERPAPTDAPSRSKRGRRPAGERGARAQAPTTESAGTQTNGDGHAVGDATETETAPRRQSSKRREAAPTTNKEIIVDAQQVGDEAERFVQGLVEAFGLSGTTSVRRDGDEIEVVVEGADLGLLVGPRGATLQAIQELTRVASQRRLGDHDTRLRVDIAGYRERRREALARFANQVAAQVLAEGSPKRLEPMSSADRKIVHDVLAEVDGVITRSEGDDPRRCVVIEPANA